MEHSRAKARARARTRARARSQKLEGKTPIAGDGEAVQTEVPQAEIYAQLLAKVESLQETVGE